MSGINDFNQHFREYDLWFEKNKNLYLSELEAVKSLMLPHSLSVEIGSGSGKFAIPLNIDYGIEPSEKMLETAVGLGVRSVMAIAESLPLLSGIFDLALMVTTVCFVDDPEKSFGEVYRILSPGGAFITGFVDRDSPLGRLYLRKKNRSKFYRSARFFTAQEITELMKISGFSIDKTVQTLFSGDNSEVENYRTGTGDGSFVAIRGLKR